MFPTGILWGKLLLFLLVCLYFLLIFEAGSSYVDSYVDRQIYRIRVSASAFWMAGLTGVALPHPAKNRFLLKAQSFPCHVTDQSSLEY